MPDNSEDRVTVWASTELIDRVDDDVDWRYESRSQWSREAAQLRLLLTDELERAGAELAVDPDDREAALREILFRGVRAADLDELESNSQPDDSQSDDSE